MVLCRVQGTGDDAVQDLGHGDDAVQGMGMMPCRVQHRQGIQR